MTNETSLLVVVWACYGCCEWVSEGASTRGWSFLSIEGEKTQQLCTHWQSEPTSAPHTAPIDESATFRPRLPHRAAYHALDACREAAEEKMDKYRMG